MSRGSSGAHREERAACFSLLGGVGSLGGKAEEEEGGEVNGLPPPTAGGGYRSEGHF